MLSSPTNIEMPWLVTSPKPPIPKAFPFGGTVRGRGTKSGASWSIPPDRGTGHSAQQPLPLPTWPRLRAPEPRLSVVRPTVGTDGPRGPGAPVRRALLTLSTSPIGHSPFNLLSAFMFCPSSTSPPRPSTIPRPGSRTHNNPHSPHEATHMRHQRKSVRQSGRLARRLSVQARSADLLRGWRPNRSLALDGT